MITALQIQVLRQRIETAAIQHLSTIKGAFLQEVWLLPMMGAVRIKVRARMGVVGSLHELSVIVYVPSAQMSELGDACMKKLTVDFLASELKKTEVRRIQPSGQIKKVAKREEPAAKKTNHFGALAKTMSRRTDDDD